MDSLIGFIIIAVILFGPSIYFNSKYNKATKKLEKARSATRDVLNDTQHLRDELAHEKSVKKQAIIDRLVKVTMDGILKGLTPSNFSTSIKRLESTLTFLNKQACLLNKVDVKSLHKEIHVKYEDVVRKDEAKRMQAEIKARIREEQREEKLREQEVKLLDREMLNIKRALDKAMKETHDAHDSEIQILRDKLLAAEDKMTRAKSMAQLTRTGHVYIISNIGSFGENVFKVGMTRRLEPLDRVKELGDASVPFPFDVHAMITSDDAPKLEHALHKSLRNKQVNKVNSRKEFFKADLEHIIGLVGKHHGEVEYIATSDAFEYRESESMSENEYKYVQQVLGEAA